MRGFTQPRIEASSVDLGLHLVSSRKFELAEAVEITIVDRVEGYGLLISFTDGTVARYTVEELLELRPYRERAPDPAPDPDRDPDLPG